MPIIPQTLNINNLRTANAKSIKLNTIRKAIKYALGKVCVKAMFTFTVFEILPFVGRRYYHPLSGVQGAKGLS